MTIKGLLKILDQQIREVEHSYQIQTGGATVCQLQKDGRISGGIKYDEGRLVALTTIQRIFKQKSSLRNFRISLQTEMKTWQQNLAIHKSRGNPAIQWVAYLQGGVDVIQQYERELENLLDAE